MPVTASVIAGGTQAVLGAGQAVGGSIRAKKLGKQLTAFHTPDEAYKLLNATESLASQGYDAFTLNYLTNNVNKSTAANLGAAMRLGADPNDLSAILGQNIDSIMKIGAENHDKNMANFSRYLSALDMIGQNKEAEWASRQNMIKDKIAQATGDKAQGMQNVQNGLNLAASAYSADQTNDLYKPPVVVGKNPDGSPKFK